MNKEYVFYIQGMHCKACVLLTESEIGELPNVVSVKANLGKGVIEISGDFGEKTREEIAKELSGVLKERGYIISTEKTDKKGRWSDFRIALPVSLGFVAFFWMLQKFDIVDFVPSGNVTYGTAFVIGIVASLSSCMAVVGGLLLSLSATFAKKREKIWPQAMFHGGRILSFFFLGGTIGFLGSAFTLSGSATFVVNILLGGVMLVLGMNLLDVFPWVKGFQLSMPKYMISKIHILSKWNHIVTPIFAGVVTFFLPCGFTQSMQLYALTTGSFLTGGFIMLAFALGTLPVLALVSFSSLNIKGGLASGVFFKTAGLLVIFFALFNIVNSFVAIGIIPPIFHF